jgi:hypothetical protein
MKSWNFINGWSLKTARVSRAVIPGLLIMFPVQVSGDDIDTGQMPSVEFLEFLGSGVQVEDEFLDPLNYTEIETETNDEELQDTAQGKIQSDDE